MIDPADPNDVRELDIETADTDPAPPPAHVVTSAHPFPTPPAGHLLGVDVSGPSQGHIDAQHLLDAGADFLWARATDGEHDIDEQFLPTTRSCAEADLPCGAYGVLEAYGLKRAAAQAAHFVSIVRGSDLWRPGVRRLAPWLDFELAHGLGGLEALRAAVAWRDAVQDALGVAVLVYTGPAFLAELAKYAGPEGEAVLAALAQSGLVVADYTGKYTKRPTIPRWWTRERIWQASGGHVVSPNAAKLPWAPHADVDVDLFEGTVVDLLALGTMPRLTAGT